MPNLWILEVNAIMKPAWLDGPVFLQCSPVQGAVQVAILQQHLLSEPPSSHLYPNLWDNMGYVPRCHFGEKQGGGEEIQRQSIYPKETQSFKETEQEDNCDS